MPANRRKDKKRRTQVGRLQGQPGLKVIRVEPGSPLFGYIRPGDSLLKVNDEPVVDTIDFHFKMAEPEIDLLFGTRAGERLVFEFED
ncbi:MAG: hypothetical protein ACE5GA_11305, partial [Candidatus Zixiibacteriota bacterium]